MNMRCLSLLLLSAVSSFATPFSFGVKAGVPLTDLLSTDPPYVSTTNRYIIGPEVELNLPLGLGVEFDAVYQHFSYARPLVTTIGSEWEFPLLAKYRFPGRTVRPYIDAGIAWGTLSGLSQTYGAICSPQSCLPGGGITTSTPSELRNSTVTGFVAGAGLSIHLLVLHVSPEIRYTRWGAQQLVSPIGGLSSNQNQAEFLVGITF
jgi:opacity protein-like surface antigen